MANFQPIAIVGRACVLPGALSPEELWDAVVSGTDLVSAVDPDRWRAPADILCRPGQDTTDKTWSNRGGYVRGFEKVWNPNGFGVPAASLAGLDPSFLWVLHTARQALADAGDLQSGAVNRSRVTAVFGNLGFPTSEMSRFAEAAWTGAESPDPRNRFMSGGSAALLRDALGLGDQTYCVDCACASSLYAIKLACDQLHEGSADTVLAGAVNGADDLFVHVGFTALQALSKTGQSRPFHAEADGLVPAEGAGFVALKRLEDAQRDGNTIYGIIRGVGLSNDGRGRGFLAPLVDGQARAIQSAYTMSGINPADVSLLECHATGTPIGDATELKSTASVFGALPKPLAIGSLKSNMGHLITTAGVAGLIKITEAMRHATRPPSLHHDIKNPTLAETPFRVLGQAEAWPEAQKIAGLSAFGFGGNNGHLVVTAADVPVPAIAAAPINSEPLAVVGIGTIVGNANNAAEFAESLAGRRPFSMRNEQISVPLKGLRFPPSDLSETIGQQVLALEATREAVGNIDFSGPRTAVFLGMEPDINVCRYGLRWRTPLVNKDAVVPKLTSAGVVGTMPNIPANRLNSQFDFGGASVTVSAGEQSGFCALKLAQNALAAGEIDVAVVAAVDLCNDPVQARATGLPIDRLGDAAVTFIVKRLSDAKLAGDDILATLTPAAQSGAGVDFTALLGENMAAHDLRDLAALILSSHGDFIVGDTFSFAAHVPTVVALQARISAGPTVIFNTHGTPLEVQNMTRQNQPSASNTQVMRAAPSLPGVGTVEPSFQSLVAASGFQAPAAQAQAQPVMHAAPAQVPSSFAPTFAATNGNPTLAAMQSTLQEIGQMQQQFLMQQSAVFAQFVAVQQAGMQMLSSSHQLSVSQISEVARPSLANQSPIANHIARLEHGGPNTVEAQKPVVISPTKPVTPTESGKLTTENRFNAPVSGGQDARAPITTSDRQKPKTENRKPTTDDGGTPVGPTLDFDQLKIHASGHISEIYGEMFKVQETHPRQVRMPEPPLLLADKVTGIDAELGTMAQKGTLWSETLVTPDRWYLSDGHVPAGILIESGQADLMLISYLGVDFLNKGKRIYRLLGCELTYYGGLPKVGDNLVYDIHLDGHAAQGDTRLMFFHSDCRVDGKVRLSVRKGQAGFFTDEELANSEGCLWKPETQEIVANPRLDAPFVNCTKNSFTKEDVRAFADGRPWDCFGPGFEWAQTHTRTPKIQGGRMVFLDDIDVFDTKGGPWKRGYLKSTVNVDPDHWFFNGHFKNDPCMPGTLMFEGCLQAMAFYISGLGYTMERDGWRFEPAEGEPVQLVCRGQVTPQSKVLTYEIFVEEVIAGPIPMIYADLLCVVDGLKAFHARRVCLKLIPGWPLDEGTALLDGYVETKEVAQTGDFKFDYRAMLACANGRPSQAFGPIYARFDSHIRVARLPNPPYHFLSRVTRLVGEIGTMQKGMEVDVEYDIPPEAFYFDENGCRTMPFAVLLEAALQPCGWLASYLGCALTVDEELFFRNLDGTGTLHVDLLPTDGTLLTKVKSTGISKAGPMIIVSFLVECLIGDVLVYEMDTVFGFFPGEALQNQIGLTTSDEQRALLNAPGQTIDLVTRPAKYWRKDSAKLAEPMLLMLDRVVYFDPTGGEAKLGTLRGEKDVDPDEWFFKAHFFQDPVQPGSLGIEAMIQLLQFYMLETGMDKGIKNPRFETLSHAHAMTWKYRGQVVPKNKVISSTIEITETGTDEDGPFAVCKASLWVDGKRIYEASNLGMRIVSDGKVGAEITTTIDPEIDEWVKDHCPTYTVPSLPMMSIVDLLAQGACKEQNVTALKDVRIKGWVTLDGPRTLRTERRGDTISLLGIDGDVETELATARVQTGTYARRPVALEPLADGFVDHWGVEPKDAQPVPFGDALPYDDGRLFHGPAFQVLHSLVQTAAGASSLIHTRSPHVKDAARIVPIGRLNPLLLDGATHSIPHDQLQNWDSKYPADKVAYPAWITDIEFFGQTPSSGVVRCEVRPDGFMGTADYPAFKIQLIDENGVWCQLKLVEACFPKGKLGSLDPITRQDFLKNLEVPATGEIPSLSTTKDGVTTLNEADVKATDWLPGTVAALYGTTDIAEIATKEHIAATQHIHPGLLPAALPLNRFDIKTTVKDGIATATGDANGVIDVTPVREFWTKWFARDPWPVEDLYYGLIERFVNRVIITDPAAFEAQQGKSLLYLGNHHVGVESLLFSIIASALNGVPTVTLAKVEHRESWLGRLIDLCFRYPEIKDPKVITFFDREDKESLPNIIKELAAEMMGPGRSLMVHVEGTRSRSCRQPVEKMSGAFLDMAMGVNAPVVPIRFYGGLPVDPVEKRLEFPVGMGKQDIYIGRPILPEELKGMPYGERKKVVVAAINALGPANAVETPNAADPEFEARVNAYLKSHDVSHEHATLACVLAEQKNGTDAVKRILSASSSKDLSDSAPESAWLQELAQRLLGQ